MKKIKITTLENEQLGAREMQQVQGGYSWCQCMLIDSYTDTVASAGAATPRPPGYSEPPWGPTSCPCTFSTSPEYDTGDTATAYLYH